MDSTHQPRPVGSTGGVEEAIRLAALSEQLEDLLGQVWACEAEWRFDDRVDAELKVRRRPA